MERVSGVSNPGALRNLVGPFLLEEIQFKRKEASYEEIVVIVTYLDDTSSIL